MAVSRYGAGILQWKESELKDVDRKSRKKNRNVWSVLPKGGCKKIVHKKERGYRGVISVDRWVREEENSLGFYVANSEKISSGDLLQLRQSILKIL